MSNLLTIDTQDFDEDDLLAGNIIYTETGKTQVISITVKDSERGKPGEGVPTGGTTGQYLVKVSDTDYDTAWQTLNIPAKTSDLINNSGFITASDIPVTSVNGQTGNVTVSVPTKTSDLVNDSNYQTSADTASYIAIHNASLTAHPDIRNKVNAIDDLIPNQASISNQLADKNFVNSSVQTATANFRGNWNDWADVPTVASDYPADYAGNKTPTVNDYLVVQDASDYTEETLEGTWRFKYTGNWDVDGKAGWHPEYQVNETPLTAAQLAALNSGITSALVANIPETPITKTSNLINDGADGLNPFINATSYANASTGDGGTVRIGASWGTTISNTGYLGARTMTAAQYDAVGGGAVVGKTTLENVLTAKGYLSSSDVDTALSNSSTNPVQNKALYDAIVGKEIIFSVPTTAWSNPSGTNPYTTVAIVTLPADSFTNNCTIELMIADKFNDFAKYGFVIYAAEAASQRIWLTALKKPTTTVYLNIKVYTYGN